MPILQQQRHEAPVRAFSSRLPEPRYNELVEFALGRRLALTTAVTHLLSSAMNAEKGMPYVPYEANAQAGQ